MVIVFILIEIIIRTTLVTAALMFLQIIWNILKGEAKWNSKFKLAGGRENE